MRKIIFILSLFLLTGCVNAPTSSFSNGLANDQIGNDLSKTDTTNQIENNDVEEINTEIVEIEEPQEQEEVLGEEINIDDQVQQDELPKTFDQDVAFASQAPFANWDEVHKEACEEAAMITAVKYLKGLDLNEQIMDEEIHKLVEWEEKNSYKIDLTASETAQIIRDYYGLTATVVADTSVESIKQYLSQGKLIIIPAAGRLLGNPYFQTPGPIFHMLVIRGYDRNEFITNDPGTRRGEAFKYKYQTLINAIHDWDHDLALDGMEESEINSTQKVMIVVEK